MRSVWLVEVEEEDGIGLVLGRGDSSARIRKFFEVPLWIK